jgi:hypothetical protein
VLQHSGCTVDLHGHRQVQGGVVCLLCTNCEFWQVD